MIFGDPALRYLARLKLRGLVRKQLRRLRQPSGILFMVMGLALLGLWGFSLLRPPGGATDFELTRLELRTVVQVVLCAIGFMSLISAFGAPGLFLPKKEIEALFSAPVSRSDLVRYRLLTDAARSLFGGLFLGLLASRRMPSVSSAVVGVVVAILTISVTRQLMSLLIGGGSGRLRGLLKGHRLTGLRILAGILLWIVLMAVLMGDSFTSMLPAGRDRHEIFNAIVHSDVTEWLLLPLRPYAELMMAETPGAFLQWLGVGGLIWLVLFELTARVPVDYREQSLETSETVARKLSRLRRGGLFGQVDVSKRAADRSVPWLFGRGPFGAVAWIKTSEVMRKIRGTLAIALLVVGGATVFISILTIEEEEVALNLAPPLIAFLGMFYLSGALRLDFRSELDRMGTLKGWPLHPARLFLAVLLPEVLLISGLLILALLIRSVSLSYWSASLVITILALPPLTFAWIATDNAVFLFAPVRYVPGQEGTLHHTGRAIVLFFLRMVLFSVVLALAAGMGFLGLWLGEEHLHLGETGTLVLGAACAYPVLLLTDFAVMVFGGMMLRRFDVARDRG